MHAATSGAANVPSADPMSPTERALCDLSGAFGFGPAFVKCPSFCSVTASRHTAPAASMILGNVVEIEDALRVLAFTNKVRVSVAKQVGRTFGYRDHDLRRISKLGDKDFFISVLRLPDGRGTKAIT